jgi:hypothetical protein
LRLARQAARLAASTHVIVAHRPAAWTGRFESRQPVFFCKESLAVSFFRFAS